MSKNLYVLISNGGDGSYCANYILDKEVLDYLQNLADNDLLEYDDIGVDGDGFHFDTIKVPDNSTAESLGISVLTMEEILEMYEHLEDEE